MNSRSSIAKNATCLFVSRVIGSLTTLVLVAIIARNLSTEDFGRYTFALSVGAILAVAADFGLLFLIPREVARKNRNFELYFIAGGVIKVVFSIVVFVALFVSLRFFYARTMVYAIYASFTMLVLRGFIDFCAAFFNAYERMHYSAMLFLISSFGIFSAGVAAILAGVESAFGVLLTQACVMLFFAGLSFLLTYKILQPKKFEVSWWICVKVLRKAAPFGLFTIGGIVYFQIDNVLLYVFRGIEEVGFYQGAMRLVVALEMIPLVLSGAIYPTISRILEESKNGAMAIAQKIIYVVLIIGMPIGITIMMLARPIVLLVFGSNYTAIVPALMIIAWLVPVRFCGHVLGTVLSASGNQKFRTWASWLAIGVNVTMNLMLLPKYGYVGAAVASVFTSVFLVSFYYVLLYLRYYKFEVIGIIVRLMLPVIAMLVFLCFADQLNVFLAVGMGLMLYFVMLVPVGVLTRGNIMNIRKLVLDKG